MILPISDQKIKNPKSRYILLQLYVPVVILGFEKFGYIDENCGRRSWDDVIQKSERLAVHSMIIVREANGQISLDRYTYDHVYGSD